MSTGTRVPLQTADHIVRALLKRWGLAAAVGVAAVGSVRRRRETVGDIELIAPHCTPNRDGLYHAIAKTLRSDSIFQSTVVDPIGYSLTGFKPGFRECSLAIESPTNPDVHICVEIFRYDSGPDGNRGWTELMRTGPREFGMWFLGCWKKRFSIPPGEKASIDGYLVDAAKRRVRVETEDDCFRIAGLPRVEPHDRDAFMDRLTTSRSQQ